MPAFSVGDWVLSKWGPAQVVNVDVEPTPECGDAEGCTVYDLSNNHWAWADQLQECPKDCIPVVAKEAENGTTA